MRWAGLLFVAGLLVLASASWFDRTEQVVVDLGSVTSVSVTNDAGPIRIRPASDGVEAGIGAANAVTVVRFDSWLFRGPTTEIVDTSRSGAAVSVECATRLPCRSSVEVYVPDGIDLTVTTDVGLVEVDAFDGRLTIDGSDRGVAVGPVSGSVVIDSPGPVTGFDLRLDELDLRSGLGPVDLVFVTPPDRLGIAGGSGRIDVEVPTNRFVVDVTSESDDVVLDVRVDERSLRSIVIESVGPVSVVAVDR